jgi:hypothetical protein
VASEAYARVDHGTDAEGKRWAVGTRGAVVAVTVDPTATELRFDGDGRDQFIKAFAEAERQAEAGAMPERILSAPSGSS